MNRNAGIIERMVLWKYKVATFVVFVVVAAVVVVVVVFAGPSGRAV